ncbi:MAG: phage tail protein [Pseudomonadota bacterium]
MADICASNWNEDDDGNIVPAPDGAPEGMAPSGVNNVLRAHQGALKRWYRWSTPATTAGTATAYALGYGVAPAALVDGMTHLVEFHVGNAVAPTLEVGGLGPLPLHYYAAGQWRAVPPALVGSNDVRRIVFHAGSGAYRLLGPDVTGDLVPSARAVARAGTLLCHGQAISRTQYAGLFAAISTAFGGGDGSTTFNLPDLRGRIVAGKDDMGGGNAGRLSAVMSSGILGAAGGGSTNTANTVLAVTGNASGTLTGNAGQTPYSGASLGPGGVGPISYNYHDHPVTVTGTLSVSASGSGMSGAFSVAQPTMIANYAICL